MYKKLTRYKNVSITKIKRVKIYVTVNLIIVNKMGRVTKNVRVDKIVPFTKFVRSANYVRVTKTFSSITSSAFHNTYDFQKTYALLITYA